jgi:hypothetical protein
MAYEEEEAEVICHFCDQPSCGLMEWKLDGFSGVLDTYVDVCEDHASLIINTKLSIASLRTYIEGVTGG